MINVHYLELIFFLIELLSFEKLKGTRTELRTFNFMFFLNINYVFQIYIKCKCAYNVANVSHSITRTNNNIKIMELPLLLYLLIYLSRIEQNCFVNCILVFIDDIKWYM